MDVRTLTYRIAEQDDVPAAAQLWMQMFEAVGNYSESDFVPDWRERFCAYVRKRMVPGGDLRYFVAEA